MDNIPYGFCQCGCGQKTTIAPRTTTSRGLIKGKPQHYINGHNRRKSPIRYVEEDRGFDTPCWVWQQGRSGVGYAITRDENGKTITAHRLYYQRKHGLLPADLQLHHLCYTRHCVNPDHMTTMSLREHSSIEAKKRWSHLAPLTDEDVALMRHLYFEEGVGQQELAKRFKRSSSHVCRIVNGIYRA